MARSSDTAIAIVKAGGNVIIGDNIGSDNVKQVVRAALATGAHVTIQAGNRDSLVMAQIAQLAPGQVTFDLT
jgi:hypothetical protein